jgi:hypothetical protein
LDVEKRLGEIADALIAEQARCESLKSHKAALAFRKEAASRRHPESVSDDAGWDDDVEARGDTIRFSERARVAPRNAPEHIAHASVSFVFGKKRKGFTREVSELVSALDRMATRGLHASGKTRVARVGFGVYFAVMHLYVFALLRLGGNAPRATNTETVTSAG